MPAPGTILIQLLDTLGTGAGTSSANADYSSGQMFGIQPPEGWTYRIDSLEIFIDAGGAVDTTEFGQGTAITNGVAVCVSDGSAVLLDMTAGDKIKMNGDLALHCDEIEHLGAGTSKLGGASEMIRARWRFDEPIELDGDKGEKLEVFYKDNIFTKVQDILHKVRGAKIAKPGTDLSSPATFATSAAQGGSL